MRGKAGEKEHHAKGGRDKKVFLATRGFVFQLLSAMSVFLLKLLLAAVTGIVMTALL